MGRKHTDIAPFSHLLIVAELINLPAINLEGLINFNFSQDVFSVLCIDVYF